jgi:hypothetical protein
MREGIDGFSASFAVAPTRGIDGSVVVGGARCMRAVEDALNLSRGMGSRERRGQDLGAEV